MATINGIIGRQREIALLQEIYESPRAEFVAVYGRRRIGKTYLIDKPHIASLACPKPMLFINGTKDKLFPVPGVKDAFAEMRKVWKSQGADNLLDTELWEIPHSCGLKAQEKMLEFLDKNLK